MKKVILFTVSLCFAVLLNAQISNTEIVPVVGLSSSLIQAVLNTITNPIITSSIDDRNFKTILDDMPALDKRGIAPTVNNTIYFRK